MNDPIHQSNVAQVIAWYRELNVKGAVEQHASQPTGNRTTLRWIAQPRIMRFVERRTRDARETLRQLIPDLIVSRDGSLLHVIRRECVYCGYLWSKHVPYGGQCLFAATRYADDVPSSAGGPLVP